MQKLRGVKITKVIGIIFITVVMGFLVCIIGVNAIAQTNEKKYQDENYVIEKALKYLEKRYDEKFIITKYQGMGPMYGYVSMEACPEGKEEPRYTFQVQGYPNKWGSLDYYDTYVMVRLTGEYEEYVGNIIGEYFDEYKFFIEFYSEWITEELPLNMHLEDLWELKANEDYPLPWLYIYIPPDAEDAVIVDMVETLSKNHFKGLIQVEHIYNRKLYDAKQRNDWSKGYKEYGIKSTGEKSYIYRMLVYGEDNVKYYQDMEEK